MYTLSDSDLFLKRWYVNLPYNNAFFYQLFPLLLRQDVATLFWRNFFSRHGWKSVRELVRLKKIILLATEHARMRRIPRKNPLEFGQRKTKRRDQSEPEKNDRKSEGKKEAKP